MWYYNKNYLNCIILINTNILTGKANTMETYYLSGDHAGGFVNRKKMYQLKNLNELKNHINIKLLLAEDKKYNKYDPKYKLSHEILLPEVPIEYIIGILVEPENYDYTVEIVNKYVPWIKVNLFTRKSINYKEIIEDILLFD